MATLTIRNVDEKTHKALRLRAAENGRSVEEEIRRILAEQVSRPPECRNPKTPGEIAAAVKSIQKLFAPLREKYPPATPLDDDPHSIPVFGTRNPLVKAYPEN